MSEDKDKLWNSTDTHHLYERKGGTILSRPQLINAISSHFGEEILVLSWPGYAHILPLQSQASKLLKVAKDKSNESDILLQNIKSIAKNITEECKSFPLDKSTYNLNVDEGARERVVSDTLMSLLAMISSRLNYTPVAILIDKMIMAVVHNCPTDLQVALGVLFRNSKTHWLTYASMESHVAILMYRGLRDLLQSQQQRHRKLMA